MMASPIGRLIAESTTRSCCSAEEPRALSVSIAPSLTYSESADEQDLDEPHQIEPLRRRRASTRLIAQSAADVQRITGESTTQLAKRCCGGGCCFDLKAKRDGVEYDQIEFPDNEAYKSLQLKIDAIPTTLSNVCDLPEQTVFLQPLRRPSSVPSPTESTSALELAQDPTPVANINVNDAIAVSEPTATQAPEPETKETTNNNANTTVPESHETPAVLWGILGQDSTAVTGRRAQGAVAQAESKVRLAFAKNADTAVVESQEALTLEDLDTTIQPPSFVQPHPPHHVCPVRMHNTRELTKPGAEKRTFHFDLDITGYPEAEGVDFVVGGAIGIMAPNDTAVVDEILDLLYVPKFLRNKPVLLRTTKGRWPTVWGDEKARELVTTRRDLLTWCSDIQSYPPTKQLLRILAEHASEDSERKILLFLCSAEGQGVFCDFRTGPHVSVAQLLHAFPSARPPLDLLLSVLQTLMPRFYSLSNDPHMSFAVRDDKIHRVIEIAVTVHESHDWRTGSRTGVGSGFLQRQALKFLEAKANGESDPVVYVPMFKGLMANPLAKQFVSDGPMLLIGAGVGIAPFRGFVQRRLKTANCANKVWVIQGIRDSLVDELYQGEWGVHEDEVKRVVQSRRGEGRYVQEEVAHQADLVWQIINSVDGRVFVCGSTKGMGEGVEQALVEVAMEKGNLGREEAKKFWNLKKEVGQYTAETW